MQLVSLKHVISSDLRMWALMGVCLFHCVFGQLFDSKLKGASRLICSVPGSPGLPGKPGPSGAPGADGNVGILGRDGRDGRKGEKGEKGVTGLKGRVGPTGKIGGRGQRGPAGKRGPAGGSGEVGSLGPSGRDGEKGQQGQRGPRGTAGTCRCGSLLPKSAFSAGITSSYPAEKTPIKFNKVLFDEGGHYNPLTGKFICAYPGNHDVASGSTVTYLNPEDEVWLEIFFHDQNGLFSDPGWTDSLFSGFLLYADTDYLDTLAEDYE
ncbi:complement C1q tumor necrosis factor-related protein 7 isoform X2 [Cottoperca gobio]|uniref:Complement C1q tumor necrosis factor-related protein 7 isoform X2 n=1 Tax=Cottoperca gobio TaxID=56716 RepID=A0A6J2P9C4_COTGO|nr:complement C1q tumor necrosis factor-related protein 7 isoform X2 [Cottoperca gobio]